MAILPLEAHRKNAVELTEAIDNFVALATKDGRLSPIVIQSLAYNLCYILGAGLYYASSGENIEEKLLRTINEKHMQGSVFPGAFNRFIMDSYNKAVSAKFKNSQKALVVDGGRKNSVKLANKLGKTFIYRFSVKSPEAALRHIFKSFRGGAIPYFVYPSQCRESEAAVVDVISQLPVSSRIKEIFKIATPYLRHFASFSSGAEKNSRKATQLLSPQFIVTDSINNSFAMAACESVKNNGGRVAFFNHTSYAPQKENEVASRISNLWISFGRVLSSYATDYIAKTPAVAAILAQHGYNPIPLKLREPVNKNASTGNFKIIYAGNFMGADMHIPYITENADEFLQGIISFAEAAGKLPEAELVIRIKHVPGKNKEFDFAALESAIKPYSNVKIDSSGEFNDVLAQSDLVVSNTSGAIDDALNAGLPVLLHTCHQEYQHMQASTSLPSENSREVLYASSKNTELPGLLEAIIKAHKGRPLTTVELEPYIWGAKGLNLDEIAGKLREKV